MAATRILSAKGYEAVSMNEIAVAAGVSVGSLYQYVPTKSVLAAMVMERRSEELATFLEPRLLSLGSHPFREGIREGLRLVIEAHRKYERLPNLPLHDAPLEGAMARLRDFERRAVIGVRMVLESHRNEIRPKNLDLAANLLVHMIDAALHAALASESKWMEGDELLDELESLVVGYLLAG